MQSRGKLNLFLDVTGRNYRNYHELFTLFAYIDLADNIEFEEENEEVITIDCQSDFPLPDDFYTKNIFHRAYSWYKKNINPELNAGFAIRLIKNIPLGGGLGGGSSNAALFLQYLAALDKVQFNAQQIEDIAYNIGADVPFFLGNRSCYMRAIGEVKVDDITFPEIPVIIINPNINVNTAKIFANLTNYTNIAGYANQPTQFSNVAELINYLAEKDNCLEQVALRVFPELTDFKQKLLNVVKDGLVRMTGSGSSYFCLFETEEQRDKYLDILTKAFPEYFIYSGKCLSKI